MNDDELDARLTAEAAEDSPVFSVDLHEQIMQRVSTAPSLLPQANWRWPAIAAAVLLVMGALVYLKVYNRMAPSPRPVVAAAVVPSVPMIRNPVRALDQPMTEWNDARYAYLDRDGQKLLGYMQRQIDVMPGAR